MRQPINLLSRRPKPRGMLWWTVCGLIMALTSLIAWTSYRQWSLVQIQASERSAQISLAKLHAEAVAKRSALGWQEGQNQAAEMARLRGQLLAHKTWADWLQKGELGQTTGPATVLQALALQHPKNLWLDSVEWLKGGPSLVLSGSARSMATVVDYARHLDQHLDQHLGGKAAFTALETQEDMQAMPGTAGPPTGVVRFKIYGD